MRVTGTVSPREALAIYLQDHHAGAEGGLALARRAAGNQRGTDAGRVLEGIARELDEDKEVLLRAMQQVDASPSPVKALAAKLAERGGRLKLNGQLLGASPLSRVIELEGLLSGVKSKQHVWMLLRDAADVALEGVDPDRMIQRADDQLERLHELWREAARSAFP